jgi:hypothetical protein
MSHQSLHVQTPLIYSQKLTKVFGKGPVYLKLENLQVRSKIPFTMCLFEKNTSATPCASPPPRPSIFPIILFLSTNLSTEMTVISTCT